MRKAKSNSQLNSLPIYGKSVQIWKPPPTLKYKLFMQHPEFRPIYLKKRKKKKALQVNFT